MGEELPQIPGLDVLSLISSGGMGDVLLAKRTGAHGFEKLVAVKTIRPELAKRPEVRAMFLDEARLVALLNHPAITHVHDFGEDGDTLYLTMEYVPGVSFGQIREKMDNRLDPLMAAQLIAEALRGLHAAHELTDTAGKNMEVVHRDVSPDNLILTFDGKVKILDFGIALVRDRETPHTELGSLKGKPAYMAPERLRGEPVDRRTDVYSAGVVLYELLTGTKLFSKGSVIATALAVESEPVPVPSTQTARIMPDGLDKIVMRAIARTPSERYASARDMAIELTDLARSHSALPLEAFVDMELAEEKQTHNETLKETLEGRRGEIERTPLSLPPAPAEARPLVDSTTLIPPASTQESAPPPRTGWTRPAMVALLIVLFPMTLTFYLLSNDSVPVSKIEEPARPRPELRALEPEIETADDVEATERAIEPKRSAAPDDSAARAPKKKRSRRQKRAKAASKAKTAVNKTFGFVTIGATPYARVRIDGKDIGATPIVNRRLTVGSHTVELLRPDTGEVREKRTVNIREGKLSRVTAEE